MKKINENSDCVGQNFAGGSACQMPYIPDTYLLYVESSAELSDHSFDLPSYGNTCSDETGVSAVFHIFPERCLKIDAAGNQFIPEGFADAAFIPYDRSAYAGQQFRQYIPSVPVGGCQSVSGYDACEADQNMTFESVIFPIFRGAMSVCGIPSENSGEKSPSEMTDRNRESVSEMDIAVISTAFSRKTPVQKNFPEPQVGRLPGKGSAASYSRKQMPPMTHKVFPYAFVSVFSKEFADYFHSYDLTVIQSGSETAAAYPMSPGQIIKIIINVTENCYNEFFY